ncbi:MAG: hypothetical protein ACMUEM_04800 [Flavobacteriales bacterium AspAUS03]
MQLETSGLKAKVILPRVIPMKDCDLYDLEQQKLILAGDRVKPTGITRDKEHYYILDTSRWQIQHFPRTRKLYSTHHFLDRV